MKKQTYFDSMIHLSGGRRQKTTLRRIKDALQAARERSVSQWESLFEEVLPAHILDAFSERKRTFCQRNTFWVWLGQFWSAGEGGPMASLRHALRGAQAIQAGKGILVSSASTSAYAQARGRLKTELIQNAHERVLNALGAGETVAGFDGHRIHLVDSTTVAAADTPDTQKCFPQSSQCAPGCGFPLIRLTALFDLNTGAVETSSVTDQNTSEITAALCDLIPRVKAGEILVGDRAYSTYGICSQLQQNGAFFVMRTTDQRVKHYRNLEPNESGDRLVKLQRPQNRNEVWTRQEWAGMPPQHTYRLITYMARNREGTRQKFHILTNLLDKHLYPAHQVAALYRRRWEIETGFRELKCLLGIDRLRSKSSKMVEKDIAMSFIAYNLIRYLHRHILAADNSGEVLRRLSFKGSIDTLKQFSSLIHQNRPKRGQLIRTLLELIFKDKIPIRPGRNEPHKRKHRNRGKEWLTTPRKIWKSEQKFEPYFELKGA